MPAILTVDDSRAVRTIVGKQVKELGFDVLEAEDGTVLDARGEAIGVATNNVAEYSALVAGLHQHVHHRRHRRIHLGPLPFVLPGHLAFEVEGVLAELVQGGGEGLVADAPGTS